MLLSGARIDENIIQVDHADAVYKAAKYPIDVSLERSRGIGQPKRQDQILKVPITRAKRSLLLILLCNRDPVVGILKVKLREVGRPCQTI